MPSISVIGTVHKDTGLANPAQLLTILERLRPAVIFLECPLSAVDAYFDSASGRLESVAVGRYLESRDAVVVPVDRPTPESAFFRDAEYLDRRVATISRDYRRVVDLNSQRIAEGGFRYLNSDDCIQAQASIYAEIRDTIEYIADSALRKLDDSWHHVNRLRDETMLKGIESFCMQTSFCVGAFLVGAAHRQSIIERSAAHTGRASNPIQWDFASFL